MAKFLIVSALAETVGLAIRLMAEGHEVLYYIHSKGEKDCGDGFLNKVEDWREHVEEADLVFFDDVRQKGRGESVYDSGNWYLEVKEKYPDKLILGGHPDVARLENDRMYAQEVLAQVGVQVVPMHRFTSFEEARRFVQENGGGWAVKHSSQVDRDANGVFFEPEKVVEFLEWLEENWQEVGNNQPVDFVLQQAVRGIEFAVTCFFDGERFRSEACYLNQEEKKLLDGGHGPSTGQMGEVGLIVPNARLFGEVLAKIEPYLRERGYCGFADVNCIITEDDVPVPLEFTCYSEDTEVLTKQGWKAFLDLTMDDEVATLNPQTHHLEYQKPTRLISYRYKGKMIHFTGNGTTHSAIDLLVTPDHEVYYLPMHRKEYVWRQAKDVGPGHLKRTAKWVGRFQDVFVIPGYTEERHYVADRYTTKKGEVHRIEHPAICVPMADWMFFLGLYISEGNLGGWCSDGLPSQVVINQEKKDNISAIVNRLADFPVPYYVRSDGIVFSSKSLALTLQKLVPGYAHERRVPRDVLDLPPVYLEELLNGLMLGDGSIHKRTGQRTYYTTSKGLADDVQELLLKIGRIGIIRKHRRGRGSIANICQKEYTRNRDLYVISERKVKLDAWIDRRNKKVVDYDGWVYCCTVPNHVIFVRRNGKPVFCGNCGRPGYPTLYSFCELLAEPVGEFLLRMAQRDPAPVRYRKGYVCTLILATGTFPDQHPTRNKTAVIHNLDKVGLRHVWLSEARWENGKVRGAGELGYLAVVTGSGLSIGEAATRAYDTISQLKVTPYEKYRTDIGLRALREFPILAAGGWLD